jgi:menaquinol-cytochrome c reductase iron-sulfur subunit
VRLSRNVFILGVVSLLGDVSSDMVMPLLPAFVVTLGGGAAFIGIIEGAAEGVSALLKYASGRWADRVRRLLPLAVAGYALAAIARPLLAFSRAPWQVLAVRSVDRVGKGIRTTPRDKLLAASTPPDQFAEGATFLEDKRLFIFREQRSFYAISAVCTHLGCTVKLVNLNQPQRVTAAGRAIEEPREFHCPCHGSKYYGDGTNYAGPAPRPLAWHPLEVSPDDGQLVVDLGATVTRDFRLKV